MNQEKILLQIETQLADLKSFVRKLKPDGRLHQLDIDLLQQKVRDVYDVALMLEPFDDAKMKATVADMKKPEVVEVEEDYDDSFQKEKRWNETKEEVLQAEDLITESQDELEKELVDDPEKTVNKAVQASKEVNRPEPEQKEEQNQNEEDPSSPDLFTSAGETVADALAENHQETLADKLTKNALESLKKQIGINDKFLFINELFNGDMRNYNNAIDELDSLKTLEGANTYLFELKIQNQWSDDLEAFQKLKALIENKFAQ